MQSQNNIYFIHDAGVRRQIYYSQDENRCQNVLMHLWNICKCINNDIVDEVTEYNIINNRLDQSLREVQTKLNVILHKTNLRLEKESRILVKCKFIKADL
jgi:hypothetical protein